MTLPWAVQKWLNQSICCLGCGSGGPKEAQVQSYSPGGTNVPSWEGRLAPPGKYDTTVHLWRQCSLMSNYFGPLVNLSCIGSCSIRSQQLIHKEEFHLLNYIDFYFCIFILTFFCNFIVFLLFHVNCVHFCRTSYAKHGLGSRNFVRLLHACFVTNPKNLPAIFLYHMKGQSL